MLRIVLAASVLLFATKIFAAEIPNNQESIWPWEVHQVELTKISDQLSFEALDTKDCTNSPPYWERNTSS